MLLFFLSPFLIGALFLAGFYVLMARTAIDGVVSDKSVTAEADEDGAPKAGLFVGSEYNLVVSLAGGGTKVLQVRKSDWKRFEFGDRIFKRAGRMRLEKAPPGPVASAPAAG